MGWAVNCVQSHTIQIYIMHNKTMVVQAMEITPTIPTAVVVQYHRCLPPNFEKSTTKNDEQKIGKKVENFTTVPGTRKSSSTEYRYTAR